MLASVVTDEGSLLPNSRPMSPTTYSMSHLGCQDASQQCVQTHTCIHTHTHIHLCTLVHVQTHRHTRAFPFLLLSPQPFQLLRPEVPELPLTPLVLFQPLSNPSASGPAPSSKPIRMAPALSSGLHLWPLPQRATQPPGGPLKTAHKLPLLSKPSCRFPVSESSQVREGSQI